MTELPESERLRGRIVANTLAQFVAPGVRVVVGVVLVAILGRYLGVGGFGEYGLVVAYVVLLTNVLAEWGLGTILVREIARAPEERPTLIASAALLQLALAALSYAGLVVVALLSSYPTEVRFSLAVFGLTLLLAPVQMLTAHFALDLRLGRLVAPAVAGTLTQFVLVVVVVALGGSLVVVIGGTLLLTVPPAIVAVLWSREIVTLVFGATFAPAAVAFAALMAAFVFVALGILLEAVLVAMGAQRVNLVVRLGGAVLLLALLLVVVPTGTATGAAGAVLVSAAVTALLTLAVIARRLGSAGQASRA